MDYKTPGVYLEEITLLPPSVAQVETAIPVFIGYTEFAGGPGDDYLSQEATRITISLLNENHEPVVVWKVKNAWPTKVTSTELNSTSNESAVETLVLTHEGLTMENG